LKTYDVSMLIRYNWFYTALCFKGRLL